MKITTYARNLHDLGLIKDQGIKEVILGHKDFSRFGKLSDDEFLAMANRARELKLEVIFEWDILMTQSIFQKCTEKIQSFYSGFDVLRVQDPGAYEWSLKNCEHPLHFIAENANHNLKALKGWVEYGKGRLSRIILSIELTRTMIEEYTRELNVPCELLGLGRILLFYTPRSLLSPLSPEKTAYQSELIALGESEESPHKGFPILENQHGTFMFHIKEFSLIDFASELKEMGLAYFRIDLRTHEMTLLPKMIDLLNCFDINKFNDFKEIYPQDLMRGFYLVNKTDVLFSKLKNHRLQNRQGDYLGEVIEAEKSSHLAVMVKNSRGIKLGDKLKILHPKGGVFEITLHSIRNLELENVELIPSGKVALISYMNGVWVKSQVFLN